MVNSFGYERGVPADDKGDCARCGVSDSMDDSRHCADCADRLASLLS